MTLHATLRQELRSGEAWVPFRYPHLRRYCVNSITIARNLTTFSRARRLDAAAESVLEALTSLTHGRIVLPLYPGAVCGVRPGGAARRRKYPRLGSEAV